METNLQEKSPLTEEEKKEQEVKYDEEELKYKGKLEERFAFAVNAREQELVELDSMSYSQYWDLNEKMASTYIEPRKNPEDSSYQSGVPREKMFSILSALENLNLSPDISAFDANNIEIGALGESVEDIIFKTEELDGDEEKKHLRQYELLKQGDAYVEEIIDERWTINKKMISGKWDGQVTDVRWTSKVARMFSRPSRNIICGLSVFPGSMKIYDFNNQPYVFTLEVRDYGETKSIYENWERWVKVPKKFVIPTAYATESQVVFNNAWRMVNIAEGQCAIVKYQNPWDNEYAVIINGVLMTPVGLPLTEVNGFNGYNIANQKLEPIKNDFAIGNSLMRRMKSQAGILDEMLRMAVLKVQQSYKPPMVNLSGRILSRKIFAPATIIQGGIPKDSVFPLLTSPAGLNASELEMINILRQDVDKQSVSPTFQGQKEPGQTTATEVLQLQRQAKLMLGLTVFACSMLEWKLSWLRLFNVLAKWFEPDGDFVDESTGTKQIRKKYRVVTRRVPIEGKGIGNRIVLPTDVDEMPTPQDIKDAENKIEERSGRPTKIVVLNVNEVNNSKNVWQISIKPREKTTSEMSKLLFREEMNDFAVFGQMLNLPYLAEKAARMWDEDPAKVFRANAPVPIMQTDKTTANGVVAPGGGLAKEIIKKTGQ